MTGDWITARAVVGQSARNASEIGAAKPCPTKIHGAAATTVLTGLATGQKECIEKRAMPSTAARKTARWHDPGRLLQELSGSGHRAHEDS